MTRTLTYLLGAGLLSLSMNTVAFADVGRACLQSGRANSPSLCRCIGRVADTRLTRAEQRTVAKWFEDPEQAQLVRQSDSRRDEQLWEKYRVFGDVAAQTCG